jgi:hypothetical protein
MHTLPVLAPFLLAPLASFLLPPPTRATPPSDPAGVYAVLDQVVLLPDERAPTGVELHGAFALAEGGRGEYYRTPRAGVLRFALGKDADGSRTQWRELREHAGKQRIVTFGSRYELHDQGAHGPRVAAPDEAATEAAARAAPPPFSTGWGVRVLENVDYGAARELALLPRCLPVDLGTEKRPAHSPLRPVVLSCTNCTASGGELRYVFTVETSDGELHGSGLVAPGKGITTWTTDLALQVGEKVAWSVHVVGGAARRAPVDRGSFVVPAAAVDRSER